MLGWRMANAACAFSTLADSLLVVPAFFVSSFLFRTIHDVALMIERERAGREANLTADISDCVGGHADPGCHS